MEYDSLIKSLLCVTNDIDVCMCERLNNRNFSEITENSTKKQMIEEEFRDYLVERLKTEDANLLVDKKDVVSMVQMIYEQNSNDKETVGYLTSYIMRVVEHLLNCPIEGMYSENEEYIEKPCITFLEDERFIKYEVHKKTSPLLKFNVIWGVFVNLYQEQELSLKKLPKNGD